MRNHLTLACSGATVLARFAPILLVLCLIGCGGGSSHTSIVTPSGSPNISSLSPTSGFAGASVTITGSNFGSTPGTVTFSGTKASVVNWADSSIVAKVPLGATTGNVVVTAGGATSNGVNFAVVTLAAGSIATDYFGMQCGVGFIPNANNCPNQPGTDTPTWPGSVAQPGLLRLWDSQVAWSWLMTGYNGVAGTYSWAQLDGYLDDIAAHPPITVNYVFGCVPTFASGGPPGPPGSCGSAGGATPPSDLTASGSPTFTQFVTDLVQHCSTANNCVGNCPPAHAGCTPNLITGFELWNEANVSMGPAPRWIGSQTQLYQMVAPAVAIIKANVSNAKIFTPSTTGGGASWMTGWLAAEIGGGPTPISDVYNIHRYLNNNLPESVAPTVSGDLAPNNLTTGWTALPWVMGETGYDDIHLPYNCNAGITVTPYSTDDCVGQMVRWNLLLFSNGGSGLYWYYWNTYIGSDPQYATAYKYMMQYLVGGKFNTSNPCALSSGTTWTCPFTEASAKAALWVWTTDEAGANFTVPSGFTDYRDLTGTTTTVSAGQSIAISVEPIMLE